MMLTSTIVLLLVGTALVVYNAAASRQSSVEMLATRAQMFAANASASLAFRNTDDARQVLSALGADPSMVVGALYDRSGRLFAWYPPGAAAKPLMEAPLRPWQRFDSTGLEAVQPVTEGSRLLGTLYLRSDLRALHARFRVSVLVVLLAVLGSLGLAYLLASWLQRGIAGPVHELADAARRVAQSGDYSLRVSTTSKDELSILTKAFNVMLETIHERELALGASEARQRAILESALDGIVTVDHQGLVVEFNPAAEQLFGRGRAAAIGTPLPALLLPHPTDGPHAGDPAPFPGLASRLPLDERVDATAIVAGGEQRPVEIALTRIRHPGEPMYTGFVRDITQRKRAENEIRQLNAELEKRVKARTLELEATNRELEAFSYSVSHDLRAPLRHINGFADLLNRRAQDRLDDKDRRYLDNISGAARNMGQLIDDLLTFSRMSRREMRSATVDLDELVRDTLADLAGEAADRSIRWRVGRLPQVHGDAALLRMVLVNLLSNALKYTSTREVAEIEIDALETPDETIFRIRDNGVGFDMTYAHKLFGVFQRLHRPEDFEGTGIGLANVRRIIQRHGGRTWGEGEVDRGATFCFTLPRMETNESGIQQEAA